MLERLLCMLYPGVCGVCGVVLARGERFFCAACEGGVRVLDGPCCSVCGRPLPDGSGGPHPCWRCMDDPPPFSRVYAPLAYEGAVKKAVHLYKYSGVRAMERWLSGRAVDGPGGLGGLFAGTTVVAAIPLHIKRLRERGFNQSLLIARGVSRAVGARLSVDGLARTRYTRPQFMLPPHERAQNVKGAFAAVRPDEFAGRDVLLVDDVYTTGATVRECASVLVKAGAHSVGVFAVARAVPGEAGLEVP